MKYLALFAMLLIAPAFAVDDPRYCGQPSRNEKGEIIRSASIKAEFRKIHPCPATGLTAGACSGWQIDHIIPLASCGCDSVANMQWLPVEIKTCASPTCKDRWERKVYECKP